MLIQGQFTTKSPLSHISDSISTGSLLNQRPILQDNSELVDVFCYNSNAWRGQIRDLCALYLIEKLNIEILSADIHNFLFSGGKIGGASKFDLSNMRKHYHLLPHFSLLGGCLDNMMLTGKVSFFDCLPICAEAISELPKSLHSKAIKKTYRRMTMEREFSRVDDAKNMRLNQTLTSEYRQHKDPVQMRMSSELLNSGVELHSRILINGGGYLELGALCSALIKFSKYPFIGGQHNKGHGLVDLSYSINNEFFFSCIDMQLETSQLFNESIASYDQHLKQHRKEILEILS